MVEFVTEEKEGVELDPDPLALDAEPLDPMKLVAVLEGITGPGPGAVREGLKIEGKVSRLEIEVSGGKELCDRTVVRRNTRERIHFILKEFGRKEKAKTQFRSCCSKFLGMAAR